MSNDKHTTQDFKADKKSNLSPIALTSEKIICFFFIILCFPIIVLHVLVLACNKRSLLKNVIFQIDEYRSISLTQFNDNGFGNHIPYAMNVIKGNISLVGAKRYRHYSDREENLPRNPNWSTPGLFSILDAWHWIGLNTNNSEREYAHYLRSQTIEKKLSILIKIWINYLLYNNHNLYSCVKFSLLNININNLTRKQCLDSIVQFTNISSSFPAVINFVNANNLNIAFKEQRYRTLLKRSDLVLPDGAGVRLACRIKQVLLKDNLNGTDLFLPLCDKLEQLHLRIFFLGSQTETLENMISYLGDTHPDLEIAGHHHGHFDENQTNRVIDEINTSKADIVLVGMGSPIQEHWIDQHKSLLKCKIVMGVGGLFDFYSGRLKRAPLWMRETGIEWLWRMGLEPKRLWKRYLLGNPLFLLRVILHKGGK